MGVTISSEYINLALIKADRLLYHIHERKIQICSRDTTFIVVTNILSSTSPLLPTEKTKRDKINAEACYVLLIEVTFKGNKKIRGEVK